MPLSRVSLLAVLCLCLSSSLAWATDEVHWTFTGATSVTLDWRGSSSGVRYGITPAYGQTASGVTPSPLPFSSSGPFWEARLTGLLPNTVYHYSIASGPDHVFRTPMPAGSCFTVYAEGDIGDTVSYWRVGPVQSLIAAGAPDFVLGIGDLTYGNANGQSVVDRHFNNVMDWSQDAAYMPAWGNHEWDSSTDDLRNYKGRFDFPNPQTSPGAPSAGCCGEDWYWFDYGNTRFIAYPEPYTSSSWSDWNTKAKALMDAAQSNAAIRFIVTYGHRPAYSSGNHPGDATLKSYLDALGAGHSKYVLNLNGHSHDYERSYPQSGVTHVTGGTGGATLEEASGTCLWGGGCPPPSWSAFRAMHHGALRLRFTPTSIHGEAICGPAGDTGSNQNDITCSPGAVFDAFAIGSDAAPVVQCAGVVYGTIGVPVHVTVHVTDPDGDAIESLTANLAQLGSGATFTPGPGDTVGTVTWTPSTAGLYAVTFQAKNLLTGTGSVGLSIGNSSGVTSSGGAALLAIDDVRPNPTRGAFDVQFSLANTARATLSLVDLAGRTVMARDLGSPGPGRHAVGLDPAGGMAPGIYWLRLDQNGEARSRRIVVVR